MTNHCSTNRLSSQGSSYGGGVVCDWAEEYKGQFQQNPFARRKEAEV